MYDVYLNRSLNFHISNLHLHIYIYKVIGFSISYNSNIITPVTIFFGCEIKFAVDGVNVPDIIQVALLANAFMPFNRKTTFS